jgi:hypothetical protein
MTEFARLENPFTVTSPEDMSAEDTVSLFVDVFTDFPKVRDPGHMFLHGPRGSGKSMMFRYLKPDCQRIKLNCTLQKLNFLSFYIPIKSTYLRLAEFQRLEGKHADVVLNEHFMTIHFTELIWASLSELNIEDPQGDNLNAFKNILLKDFYNALSYCGWQGDIKSPDDLNTVKDCLEEMLTVCKGIYSDVKTYLRKLSFEDKIIPYDKALCGYNDFLLPLLRSLKKMPFMPDGSIYLLIDDADNLSNIQTRILNSWVSTRTGNEVSLKISTQHQYKTYYTTTGTTIDTPHDYAEINISTVYTSSIKNKYMNRIEEIVRKRLDRLQIDPDPVKFFPEDDKQEKEIDNIAAILKEKWAAGQGRGYRASDDVIRYARPDYIKALAGPRKSSSTYCYAGFAQLVHISSGIIRYFLDAASHMYNETKSLDISKPIHFIPPDIQSKVVRNEANKFMFDELAKITSDKSKEAPDEALIRKLSNLIHALGGLFRAILLSDRSERRVFSIAFSDEPPKEIQELFNLGVRLGYFHESTIGKKDSLTGGRTRLYILSRRLAPLFNLDPTSFAGYLFVTSEYITRAIQKPGTLLNRLKRYGIDDQINPVQLPLFEE